MPKKVLKGEVVSDKMQKTVVVAVDMIKKHPVYTKTITRTRRYKARDEIGVKIDDTVLIEETRPISKEVTWLVKEIVEED